jgi:hypothetical protein
VFGDERLVDDPDVVEAADDRLERGEVDVRMVAGVGGDEGEDEGGAATGLDDVEQLDDTGAAGAFEQAGFVSQAGALGPGGAWSGGLQHHGWSVVSAASDHPV